jgi:hypothetical protein
VKLSILAHKLSVTNNNQNMPGRLACQKQDRDVSGVVFVDYEGLNKDKIPEGTDFLSKLKAK